MIEGNTGEKRPHVIGSDLQPLKSLKGHGTKLKRVQALFPPPASLLNDLIRIFNHATEWHFESHAL
jgi:hypothetical protein